MNVTLTIPKQIFPPPLRRVSLDPRGFSLIYSAPQPVQIGLSVIPPYRRYWSTQSQALAKTKMVPNGGCGCFLIGTTVRALTSQAEIAL